MSITHGCHSGPRSPIKAATKFASDKVSDIIVSNRVNPNKMRCRGLGTTYVFNSFNWMIFAKQDTYSKKMDWFRRWTGLRTALGAGSEARPEAPGARRIRRWPGFTPFAPVLPGFGADWGHLALTALLGSEGPGEAVQA